MNARLETDRDVMAEAIAADLAPRRVTILGVDRLGRLQYGGPSGACARPVRRRGDHGAIAMSRCSPRQARQLGARLAVVADASRYAALKEALAGSGIEAAAGDGGAGRGRRSRRPTG